MTHHVSAVDTATPTVVLVSDQQILTVGIRHAVEVAGLTVLGDARTAASAETLIEGTGPDLVLVVSLADEDLADLVHRFGALAPAAKIVVLSGDDASADLMLASLMAGADGWLDLDTSAEVLGRTLGAVHRGETGISRRQVTRLLSALRRPTGRVVPLADGRVVALTPREHQAFVLLAQGAGTRGVADGLGVAVSTARWHIAGLMKKLQVTTRAEVASLGRFAGAHRAHLPAATGVSA